MRRALKAESAGNSEEATQFFMNAEDELSVLLHCTSSSSNLDQRRSCIIHHI